MKISLALPLILSVALTTGCDNQKTGGNGNSIKSELSIRSHGGVHLPIDIVITDDTAGDIGETNVSLAAGKLKFNTVLKYKNFLNFGLSASIKDKSGNPKDIADFNPRTELPPKIEFMEISQTTAVTPGQKGSIASNNYEDIKHKGVPTIGAKSITFKELKPDSSYLLILSYDEDGNDGTVRYHQGAVVFQVAPK
ncbi:hypothetical protein [Armatimonas sp.]|uniref:hypothetical protein n=1 Tax=Armatimonas sp. TaxID=1872638 RepID=UPI00375382D5